MAKASNGAVSKDEKLCYKKIYNYIVQDDRITGLEKIGFKKFEDALRSAYSSRRESALPPITRSHFQEPRPPVIRWETSVGNKTTTYYISYFALFETLSLDIRKRYFSSDSTALDEMRSISSNEIRTAILKFIHECEKPAGERFKAASAEPPALKIIGCRIRGDLDLSNLDIAGSIRLVGCVIEGALILDRTKLVTLDLSGSIIKNGISGMYMTLDGALRMRRVVSQAPVDLGGLTVDGSVDFTDAILSPENNPSVHASYVRDRGILNLAQSTLKRDLRMERARIYCGINLRGAKIGGLFHLNDAILRSPTAHFEFIVAKLIKVIEREKGWDAEQLKDDGGNQLLIRFPLLLSQSAVETVAKQLHPGELSDSNDDLYLDRVYHNEFADPETRREWEQLGRSIDSETSVGADAELQTQFMMGSRDIAESALRAEQMTVEGPVYARGLRTSGQLKMGRLTSGGNVGFNGARLRSARDVRIGLKSLKPYFDLGIIYSGVTEKGQVEIFKERNDAISEIFKRLENEHLLHAKNIEEESKPENESNKNSEELGSDYVLNLDHARIKGDLDFSWDKRPARPIQVYETPLKDALRKARKALVERYTESSTLTISPNFTDTETVQENKPAETDVFEKNLPAHFRTEYIGDEGEPETKTIDYNPTLIIGDIKIDNVIAEGSVDFRDVVFNLSQRYLRTDRKSIRARNLNIRLHLNLQRSVGMNGICLTSAQIGGSVHCYDISRSSKYEAPDLGHMSICHPVWLSKDGSGTPARDHVDFDLNLAKIRGSAFLVFHPEHGPNLTFEEGHVENQTYIFAPDGCFASREPSKESFRKHGVQHSDQKTKPSIKERINNTIRSLWTIVASILSILFSRDKNDVELCRIQKGRHRTANVETLYPLINLRGLTSSFFSHNPGAWPVIGKLQVRNVRYETTDSYGHLFPRPKRVEDSDNHRIKNYAVMVRYSALFLLLVVVLIYARFFIHEGAKFSAERCYLGDIACMKHIVLADIADMIQAFGPTNIVATLVVTSLLFFAIRLSKHIHPHRRRSKPLAQFWLDRQAQHLNTRRVSSPVRPTEPFIRASIVLRGANRNISAANVELERLRARSKTLSRSKSLPTKLLLSFIDGFIGYGFKPARGISITLVYALFASMIFHGAKSNGFIVPNDIVELYEERRVLGHHGNAPYTHSPRHDPGAQNSQPQPSIKLGGPAVPGLMRDGNRSKTSGGGNSDDLFTTSSTSDGTRSNIALNLASSEPSEKVCGPVLDQLKDNHFHSFLFTIDSLVPFIDMDVERDWKVMDPVRLGNILGCTALETESRAMLYDWAYIITIIAKMVGWGLITALAFSLLIRFETLLIRQNS